MRTRIASEAIVLAALMGAAVLALAAPVGSGTAATVEGDGIIEAGATDPLIFEVDVQYTFPALIAYLAPEWSHVKKGEVVARLECALMADEKRKKEAGVVAAEAQLQGTLAASAAALAQTQGAVASAESAQRTARQRLAAVEAQPGAAQAQELALQVQENASESAFAAGQVKLLSGLNALGLCSDAEMASARHDIDRLAAQAGYLAALALEQKPAEKPIAVRQAESELSEADLKLQAAQLRNDSEVERQGLLCEAARCGRLQEARRQLDLTNRRIEAMTMRAPSSGYVMFGTRWEHGMWRQKLVVGETVRYAQTVASIVDPSRMRIRARVAEVDVPRVRVGDAVEVRSAAVPGKTYAGTISDVLATIATKTDEFAGPAGQGGAQRYGTILVALTDADTAVRPGMTVRLTIAASAGPQPAESPHSAVADPVRDVFLRGQVGSQSLHSIAAPLAGRVRRIAELGVRVKAGDPLFTLAPGLEADWREADESELKRLDLLRQAAQVSVQLERDVAPVEQAAATAGVEAAELNLDAQRALPLTSDGLSARNALQEAQWQSAQLDARRDVYKSLAARGIASGADVARFELEAKLASARVKSAQARLDKTLRGASAPDLAVAQAELDLARTRLQKAETTADQALAVARASLAAAEAGLETFQKQAERRRQQAESATVTTPVAGVVADCWASVGDMADKGDVLMRVAAGSRSVVRAALGECDLAGVAVGMPAEVELAGLPGRTFAGHVSAIEDSPQTPWYIRQYQDQSSVLTGKLFQAVIELDEQAPLYIGMSAQVRILRSEPGLAKAGGNDGHG